MMNGLAYYLVLALLSLAPGPSRAECHKLMMTGRSLTPEQAGVLEAESEKHPENIATRIKLIGFYRFGGGVRGDSRRYDHILYLVEHFPEAEALDDPLMRISRSQAPDQYEKAASLWQGHIERQSEDAKVLSHAAGFLTLNDFAEKERILLLGKVLQPDNPDWYSKLGQHYKLTGRGDMSKMATALTYFEEALVRSTSARRAPLLEEAAEAALGCDEFKKAQSYAERLLDLAVEGVQNWNYGNAVHKGNIVLGRIALQEGRIEDAERFLLKAGKTPGSPQLGSFGPNMTLALELLKKERRESVIEYLKLCKKFWKRPKLDAWIATIEAGGIPSFGANLRY